jgi:hypothetical protein
MKTPPKLPGGRRAQRTVKPTDKTKGFKAQTNHQVGAVLVFRNEKKREFM